MTQERPIDSGIDLLRKMLEEPNNELSSEQRSKLKKGIRDLKRLKRASKLTYAEVHKVVGEIAKAAFEILISGRGK